MLTATQHSAVCPGRQCRTPPSSCIISLSSVWPSSHAGSERPPRRTFPVFAAAAVAATDSYWRCCFRKGSVTAAAAAAADAGWRRRGGDGGAAAKVIPIVPHSAADGRGAAAVAAADPPPRMEEPSTALLLAWFACANRSLFAAQCLVEVLVELYREGRTFGELQLSLKLAAQQSGSRAAAGPRQGVDSTGGGPDEEGGEEGEMLMPPLLQGQEEDVLVSWAALVFLTLEELGVPRDREFSLERRQQQQQQQAPEGLGSSASASLFSAAAADGGDFGADMGLGAAGSSSSSGRSMAAGNTYLRGMLGYVRQTLGMYDEGQTLARVAGLQGLVQQSSGAATSPFMVLMQQYTRLVLLSVEVVAAAGLPTGRPLRPPETVQKPSGYSLAFISSCSAVLSDDDDVVSPVEPPPPTTMAPTEMATTQQQQPVVVVAAAAAENEMCPDRGLAVRLLMAFMGAALGSQWSLTKFVEAVRVAYEQGLAADELFSQLDDQEFVQSGGLLPIAGTPAAVATVPADKATAAGGGGGAAATSLDVVQDSAMDAPQYQITKALFSTWISLSYMTMAQLAVPYPAAGQRLGWAWAGFGDPTEALGMNDFVGNVLRQMAGEDPRVIPLPEQQPQPRQQPQQQEAEDPERSENSGGTSGASLCVAPAGTALDMPGGAETSDLGSATYMDPESKPDADAVGENRRRGGALMVRVEDESLPATSTAVRVLTQQVALVQAMCRQVMMISRQ